MSTAASKKTKVIAFLSKQDIKYSYKLRDLFPTVQFKFVVSQTGLVFEAAREAKNFGTHLVLCTSPELLRKLVRQHDASADIEAATTYKYKGSMFHTDGLDILILHNLQLLTFSMEARWLAERYVRKLVAPNFPTFPTLDWQVLRPDTVQAAYEKSKNALMIAVDIETARKELNPALLKDDPKELRGIWVAELTGKKTKPVLVFAPLITMVSYTCLYQNPSTKALYSESYVLNLHDMIDITWMRKFNLLKAPKVLQNGGYDSTYFLRYQAPLHNYLYDTFIAMHAWVAELPRNLSYITALFDRGYVHWKDEGSRNQEMYCAKDTHNTLWSMVYWLIERPDWAWENYLNNFRMQFPAITCGMEGWAVDSTEKKRLHTERALKVEHNLKRLYKLVAPGFNPKSPPQTLKLMQGLGYKKATASDDKTLQDFIDSHPLWDVVGSLVKAVRKDSKAISTYFEVTLLNGRMMYELNPAGTDTGRMASKASNLWCGTQIQNIPYYAKSMLVADPGWELASADNSQSESRCTAYLSEDAKLIATVESPLDFHKTNCTLFFGLPYESITKEIRDTGKRVNHGANYNMGERVLLQTMGRKAVVLAQRLLGLPRSMGLLEVCKYLLSCFARAYPDVKGKFYDELRLEVKSTGMLSLPGIWYRKCFGDIDSAKHIFNSYVAHKPQCLSVQLINSAFFDCWLQMQIREKKVRFKAQVHDDLIWQNRPEDTKYVSDYITSRMRQGVEIRGRMMVIPNDLKTGGRTWKDLKD